MISTLKNKHISILPSFVKEILAGSNLVFNPSYVESNKLHYLAIRVCCETQKQVLAKLFIWDCKGLITNLDLSEYFKFKEDLVRVADPKLFVMNNNVWCTFNTGYVAQNNNAIYLFEIKNNTVGNYFECLYSNRQKIEKNWAFYFHENQIYCLYSLDNLKVLKGTVNTDKSISFTDYRQQDTSVKGYSIGTPMLKYKENSYLIAGHRKIEFKGKRLYLGRIFKIDFKATTPIKPVSNYLIYSLKSLFGAKVKLNKHLFSCTYFSGLSIKKEQLILSYGINDVSWGISKLKLSKLWR